jgi:Superfamily II DNA and RNA helicases
MFTFTKNKDKLFFFLQHFSNEIKNLALEFFNNPVNIEVEDEEQNIIKQVFYEVNSRDLKDSLIEKLIKKYQANSTIIFCNQRITCEELADSLFQRDIDAITLHSDLDQKQRMKLLLYFQIKVIQF